jgi:hypothetical protein
MIGTLLSRNVYIKFGHSNIYPNQYILLTGGPGTRKGTAIRIGKELIKSTGFKHFAPNRAAKEAMWHQMGLQSAEDFEFSAVTEMYIAQDEFVDFVGIGNDELVTNLTNLWDNLSEFINPKLTKEDVYISKPTINIISGSAPGTINEAFSSLALSGGFFSRVLFIYGGYSGTKVTWPSMPDAELQSKLAAHLSQIRELTGEVILGQEEKQLLDAIYKGFPGVSDRRFSYYAQRRFTHLLKLIIIVAASRLSLVPNKRDIILANTILHVAELRMPYALGEYGKSKFSEVASTIMEIIKASDKPINSKELWKQVSQDLDRFTALTEILQNLLSAGRIQQVKKDGKTAGYLPMIDVTSRWADDLIDFSLVEREESPAVQFEKEPDYYEL